MRCKNLYHDDRICDLCKDTNVLVYNECYGKYLYKLRLHKIARGCPYKEEILDGRYEIDVCTLKEKNKYKSPYCDPTLSCEGLEK